MRRLFLVLLLSTVAFAQVHTTVTVEDTQTITGPKTFNGSVTLGNLAACTGPGCGSKQGNNAAVNVIYDCSVVGDGVTDDGPAIQTCINSHPGHTIFFPSRIVACTGGGCADKFSYYSSQTLTMSGNGQQLLGESPSHWNSPVMIKFATGIPGIRIPNTCFGCVIKNLGVYGQAGWTPSDLTTFPAWTPAQLTGDGADGIQVLGGEPIIEGVAVLAFGRHGIFLDGGSSIQSPSQVDQWRITNVIIDDNRAYGIFPVGGDANTGLLNGLNSLNNMLAGVYDYSQLGNQWNMPASAGDGRNIVAAGATSNISSISCSGTTVTIVSATPVAGSVASTWVTVAGTSNFNGTYKLTGFSSTSNFSYTTAAACPATENAGTVGTASSADVFTFLTGQSAAPYPPIVHAAFAGRASGSQVWINPYCESTSFSPAFGGAALVLGGQCAVLETAWGHAGARTDTNKNLVFDGIGVQFHNHSDTQFTLDFYPGATTTQVNLIRFFTFNGTPLWSLGTNGGFSLKDETINYFPMSFANGIPIFDSSGTNPIRFQQNIGTGGVQFYGGTANPVASVDSSGKGTFNGGLSTGGNSSTGHAMCWKDASHLGYCSTVVAADGTCTCN